MSSGSGSETILRLFTSWIDGLAAALVWVETLLSQPRRFQLRTNSRLVTLHPINPSGGSSVISIDPTDLDKIPPELIEKTRGATLEIVVPAVAILERRLDPLPAESLPYVENVVLHQIDSLFPWPSSESLHSTRIEQKADGMLDVLVRATPRSAIEPGLVVANACHAGEILIVGENHTDDKLHSPAFISCIGPEKERKLKRARFVARWAIAAAFVLTACVMGWTTFVRWSLDTDVAALDQAIADRRDILKRSLDSGGAASNSGPEAKKRLIPAAVVVLDELSSILPDGTYLTDLSMEAGRLRITGVSANAAELVPIIEGSGQFRNAAFYAPTTRQSDGATDRFSIEATILTTQAKR